MTRTVRDALMRHGADFVFALDGDEFLKAPRRELLDDVLATLPHRLHAAERHAGHDVPAIERDPMQRQTYIPEFEDVAPAQRSVLARAKRRLALERHGLHKVIIAQAFADTPEAVVAVDLVGELACAADQQMRQRDDFGGNRRVLDRLLRG
ncbi:MAG: hypothetical protein M3023_04725 [Pseudomonadota bacterium]|nr:hypothetical protein [Pseudomonadota bacterium]